MTAARLVALDTETTGTDPTLDRVVQLFAMEVTPNFEIIGERNYLFNPGIPIPPSATAIHGILDADVMDKPRFSDCAADLQPWLQDAVLIAYNGRRYDWRLLHHELVRAGQPGFRTDQLVIDPYQIFLQDLPRTLDGASRFYLGRPHSGAHEAASDTKAALSILREQLRRRGLSTIDPGWGKQDPGRIDMAGHFYRDGAGVIRFGFGRFRDETAASQPAYLQWMLTASFPADAVKVAHEVLARIFVGEGGLSQDSPGPKGALHSAD